MKNGLGTPFPRDASSKGRFDHKEHVVQGPHCLRDQFSMGRNIRDFLFGDTSVGDTLACWGWRQDSNDSYTDKREQRTIFF